MLISVCPSPDDDNDRMDVEKELFYVQKQPQKERALLLICLQKLFLKLKKPCSE